VGAMDTGEPLHRARVWRWLLWPSLVLSFVLFAVPQVFFIAMGLHRNLGFGRISETFTATNYIRIVSDPLYRSSFLLTVALSLAVTVVGLVLGFPTAYVLARARARWASWLVSVLVISSFITVVIKVLGLIVILGNNGLVNTVLRALGLPAVRMLGNEAGVLVGLVHYTLPFLVLILFSMVQTIPRSLEDAAAVQGASRFGVFRRVVLPLAMPGVITGGLIAFNMSMGAFTSAVLLGGGRVLTLPVLIQRKIVFDVDYPLGSALSTALVVSVLALNVVAGALAVRFSRTARMAT
jgi:ABC-type spermidine/putrescine transport system permease subunit I